MHARRVPDLHAEPVTLADPVADPEPVADTSADSDPDPLGDAGADADPDTRALELGDGRSVAALVLPPTTDRANARMLGQRLAHRSPQRPGTDAVHDHDLVETGEQRIVQMGIQSLERRLHPLAVEVEAGCDALRCATAHLLGLHVPWRWSADRLGDDLDVVGWHDEPSPLGLQRDPTGATTDLHDPSGAAQRS